MAPPGEVEGGAPVTEARGEVDGARELAYLFVSERATDFEALLEAGSCFGGIGVGDRDPEGKKGLSDGGGHAGRAGHAEGLFGERRRTPWVPGRGAQGRGMGKLQR